MPIPDFMRNSQADYGAEFDESVTRFNKWLNSVIPDGGISVNGRVISRDGSKIDVNDFERKPLNRKMQFAKHKMVDYSSL